jgi:hypothetical protein
MKTGALDLAGCEIVGTMGRFYLPSTQPLDPDFRILYSSVSYTRKSY